MENVLHYPLVCTRGVIIFPEQEVIIDVGRPKSVKAIEESQLNYESHVCLVAQRDLALEEPDAQQLYAFGTLCEIRHVRRLDGYLRVKFIG